MSFIDHIKFTQPSPGAPASPAIIEFVGPTRDPIAGVNLAHGQTSRHVYLGITRREYFMARAPMPVPKWFFPVMRPCPIVPSTSGITDPGLLAGVEACLDADCDDPEANAWIKARDDAAMAQEQWQAEFRQELLLQWPGYWADEMLKRSGA